MSFQSAIRLPRLYTLASRLIPRWIALCGLQPNGQRRKIEKREEKRQTRTDSATHEFSASHFMPPLLFYDKRCTFKTDTWCLRFIVLWKAPASDDTCRGAFPSACLNVSLQYNSLYFCVRLWASSWPILFNCWFFNTETYSKVYHLLSLVIIAI